MKIHNTNRVLSIYIKRQTKKDILENISKFLRVRNGILHIASINPEILIQALRDDEYKKIIEKSQIHIIDGIGVVMAAKILGINVGARITGVDLTSELFSYANNGSLRVLLIGGGETVAEKLADCQQSRLRKARFRGIMGVKNVRIGCTKKEREKIDSIVIDFKPHLVFVAFGSPFQEKWIWKNRALLKGAVCMGVGGTFDFLSGNIARAPMVMRNYGLEWLYRLVRQPWRIKRHTRLAVFFLLIIRQRILELFSGKIMFLH